MNHYSSDKQKEQTISHKKLPSIVQTLNLQNSAPVNPKPNSHNKKSSNTQNFNPIKKLQMRSNSSQNITMTKKYLNHVKLYASNQIDSTQNYLLNTIRKLETSTKNLNNFHKKRQAYRSSKQNIEFAIINKELKLTKQKLKNKNHKPLNYSIKNHQPKKSQSVNEQTHQQTFDRFQQQNHQTQKEIFKRNLQQRLSLVRKILNEEEMQEFQLKMNEKIMFFNKKYRTDQKLKKKVLNYFISYSILQRFLQQTIKDSNKLILKQQNLQLYYKIKDSMVGLLANQQYFLKHINQIQSLEQERQRSLLIKTLQNQQRFIVKSNKTAKGGKFYTSLVEGGQHNLLQRIEQLLQISKNNIKQAFINFNKPHLMYEIELQFNKRFNNLNNHLMAN